MTLGLFIDSLALAYFTLEYLARLLSAPNVIRFGLSLHSFADLLAILPDYLGYAESAAYYRPYMVRRAYATAVWPLWQQAAATVATGRG